MKKNISIELAKKEILKTVEKDKYYDLLKRFIKDYRQFREKNLH